MSTLNPLLTKKLAPIEPPIVEPHRATIKMQPQYDRSASSRVYAKVFARDWTADIRVLHFTLGKITGQLRYPAGTEVDIPPVSVPAFSLPPTVRDNHVNDELDVERKLCIGAKSKSDKNRVLVVSNSDLVDPKHAVVYYNAPRGMFEVLCTSHKGIKVNNVSYFPWDGSVDLVAEQTLVHIGDTVLTICLPSSSSAFLDIPLITSQTLCIPSSPMGTRSFIDYARSDLKPPHPFPELIARVLVRAREPLAVAQITEELRKEWGWCREMGTKLATSVKMNLKLHSKSYRFQRYLSIPEANADDTLWYLDLTRAPIMAPISSTPILVKKGSAREFRGDTKGWRKRGMEVEYVKLEEDDGDDEDEEDEGDEEEKVETKEKLERKRPKITKAMDNWIKENVDLKADLLRPRSYVATPPSLAPPSPPLSDLALESSSKLPIGKTDCSRKELRSEDDTGMQTPVSPTLSPFRWGGENKREVARNGDAGEGVPRI